MYLDSWQAGVFLWVFLCSRRGVQVVEDLRSASVLGTWALSAACSACEKCARWEETMALQQAGHDLRDGDVIYACSLEMLGERCERK